MDSFSTFDVSLESSSAHLFSEPVTRDNSALVADIPTDQQQLSSGYDSGNGFGGNLQGGCVIA